jgi:hypothetical protein
MSESPLPEIVLLCYRETSKKRAAATILLSLVQTTTDLATNRGENFIIPDVNGLNAAGAWIQNRPSGRFETIRLMAAFS